MPALIVRYEVVPEHVDDIVEAVEVAFAAANERQPEGIRWTYWQGPGDTEFGAILELADGVENPLPGIAAARGVQEAIAKAVAGEPPTPKHVTVIGSYGPGRSSAGV
ncbi:hypothetical protein [Mycobacterium palustre]|uniref:Uncharacterized protein n=1 Tax=Mycobacterium palustre TaxID=153971 RepID=A0A1X1Z239_9MYCO|nr:hypothetical protein [Mycobacterium palustre]MCV7103398.1 hypothetical protein [Mycobacterium palustre]ORW17402.1 hypothetical protein AWC19_20880 [Mycobacterium palustre]